MTAPPTPECQHCAMPKVRGRLWGWWCALCDDRPLRHRPHYSTECLTCGARYESPVVTEVTTFQDEHDRAEHHGASAWRNTSPLPHIEGEE